MVVDRMELARKIKRADLSKEEQKDVPKGGSVERTTVVHLDGTADDVAYLKEMLSKMSHTEWVDTTEG